MATREQIAWASGLFEGEGSFSISVTTSKRANGKIGHTKQIRAKLAMTDEDVVRKFHTIIGFGSTILVKPWNPKHSLQWLWSVGKVEEVRQVYLLMRKHLGIRRSRRARELIAIMDDYKKKPFMKRGIIETEGE